MLNINDSYLNYIDIKYNQHIAEETQLSYFLEYPSLNILRKLPNEFREIILNKNQLYIINAASDISESSYVHYDLNSVVRLKEEHLRILENLNISNYSLTFENSRWDRLYDSFQEYVNNEYDQNFINDTAKENSIKLEEIWIFSYFDHNWDFNMFVSYNLESLLEYLQTNLK